MEIEENKPPEQETDAQRETTDVYKDEMGYWRNRSNGLFAKGYRQPTRVALRAREAREYIQARKEMAEVVAQACITDGMWAKLFLDIYKQALRSKVAKDKAILVRLLTDQVRGLPVKQINIETTNTVKNGQASLDTTKLSEQDRLEFYRIMDLISFNDATEVLEATAIEHKNKTEDIIDIEDNNNGKCNIEEIA